MWPGLVGKGGPGAEPPIDLDTMLNMTAAADVDGTKFDGVDLFLFDPHVNIDSSDDDVKRLADKIRSKNLVVGSLVAPVWGPTGGGSAMGSDDERKSFVTQVRKACEIGKKLRDLGIRKYGVIRIDSSASPADWAKDPAGNTKKIAETFRKAADIAEQYGERLAAEGEICWGGMHSVRRNVELLEAVDRPDRVGFQADMAHTLLFTMGYNAPEDRILPENFDWSDRKALDAGLREDDSCACGRGRSISTSRRTTRRSRVRDRTTRPAATASHTIPTASSISSNTPAAGFVTRTAG